MPRGVAGGIFLSYFAVFTVLLLAFALAIHFSFVASLQAQMSARLNTLLLAGARSAHIAGSTISVRQNFSPTALLAAGQGLQWFDASGKQIASEGLVPQQERVSTDEEAFFRVGRTHLLRTRVRPMVSPATGETVGLVRAAQDVAQTRGESGRLDEILIIGGLFTLAAGALGGRYLQIRSVQPIQASYDRLQEFSADASHELRGPVTAVKSNAEAALRDADDMRPADRERFTSISQAAAQMALLTDDLLLLARADQSMERELYVVDLTGVLKNLARLYGAEFESRHIELVLRVPDGMTVFGNPDQVERIFANLLQNALRYTPEEGGVEIEGAAGRSGVVIRVRDTGIGIPADQHERIFDRFWRAEAARTRSTGTGLGLPIARALARRHGGDVTLSSAPGRGSEFVVTFPARPPA